MAAYEYRVEHRPAGTRMGPLNERLEGLAADGWEPMMMAGDNELYIMLRRARAAAPVAPMAPAAQPIPISDEG
jgi:hypothetical protein